MARIVFMGSPAFAVPTLERLAAGRHQIAGVFTQPDRPAGRGRTLMPSPVKAAALALGIPVFQPARLRSGTTGSVHSANNQRPFCFAKAVKKKFLFLAERACRMAGRG